MTDKMLQVYRREGEVYRLHRPGTGSPGASTRAQQVYSPTEDLVTALPELCLPASVSPDGLGSFTLLPRGPALYDAADSSTASAVEDFWTFLRSWGGEWMWDHCQLPLGLNQSWIASWPVRPSMSLTVPTTDSRGQT